MHLLLPICGKFTRVLLAHQIFQHIMHKLNMKHEKHPWFIRDSNPVPLGQKSGALTTELPGHLDADADLKILNEILEFYIKKF
jgi:hypothetical protein